MKILVNASTIFAGGALQVTLSFLDELKSIDIGHEYLFILNGEIRALIDLNSMPENVRVIFAAHSPAKLRYRREIVTFLNTAEQNFRADVVFSVFGPSYWRPKAAHIIGVADGWIYNKDSLAYKNLSHFSYLKRHLLNRYKMFYFRRDADAFILETDDACEKFRRELGVSSASKPITKVSNVVSSNFYNYEEKVGSDFISSIPPKQSGEFRFCCISYSHPNKNLEIIRKVVPLLDNHNVSFLLTLPDDVFKSEFSGLSSVYNLGPIEPKNCPYVYDSSDALFFPSLLETFSVSYLEAMIMNIPIITSNLSFAKDLCGDAAIYFDPLDPFDIKNVIEELVNNKFLRNKLISNGALNLNRFPTARARALKYIELCEVIA